MSRKIVILIIIIFVIIITGLFGTAYLISRETGVSTGEVLKEILPFGSTPGDINFKRGSQGGAGDSKGGQDLPNDGDGEQPRLRQLTSVPIVGATAFEGSATSTRVRYMERQTGNFYEINLDENSRARISNTTIPGANEIVWGEEGNAFVFRYLDDDNRTVRSFAGILPEETPEETGGDAEIDGSFLADNLESVASSPDKTRIFYLDDVGGSVAGITANFDGGNKNQIFEFPFTEWNAEWPSQNTIALTTRPTQGRSGYLYFLDTRSGLLTRVLARILGLTAKVAPSTNFIFYTESTGNDISSFVFNRETGGTQKMSFTTFPEKCVWSNLNEETLYCGVPITIPNGVYPDDWYQGLLNFDDTLWEVDVETGSVSFLASPREIGRGPIDVTEIFLNENETQLFFKNKADQTLWSLKIAD